MNSEKGTLIKFLVLILVCVSVTGDVEVRCMESEREALLSFKNGLIDEFGILSSWQSDDCCKWYGVVCSNTTSHVVRLELDTYRVRGKLGGKISSSLLELHHLTNLDLSDNDFGGHPIPKFIYSMKQLQNLILCNSNFAGIVPPQLGYLTSLRSLDLSYNYLTTDNLDWLSSLSSLCILDLSGIDLRHTNWLQHISNLHSLQKLHLESCNIIDVEPSTGLFVNSSSTTLSILNLSDNQFTLSAFDWLSNISTSLVKIDLSLNALGGLIPNAFDRFSFLEYVDFSSNMLGGQIPKSLGNRTHLRVLVLYDNDFNGYFDESFGIVFANGSILSSLQILDLESNQLKGPVPDLGAFTVLTEIYLGSNKFSGTVPLSLGQLSKLEVVDVSNNNLEGRVSESHLINFDSLKVLGFSFNTLMVSIAPEWTPPFQLLELLLAGCTVGPVFPRWIQSQTKLEVLDLSGAGITDEVPKWLWNLFPSMLYLVLSGNQISGTLSDLSSTSIESIDVSSNNISGPIPLFSPNIESVQLSGNMFSGPVSSLCEITLNFLYFIDLSNNQLSGEVPNCWEKVPYVNYLNLANNRFWGEIPPSLGSLHVLKALQLRENHFSGELPSTLRYCQELQLIDVGRNELAGHFPAWIGSLPDLVFLNFRNNRFYGSISFEICNLTRIRILDISRNNLSGELPDCFTNFRLLSLANRTTKYYKLGFVYSFRYNVELPNDNFVKDNNEYSTVQWKGQESEYRKTLPLLTLIDLSSNKFIGSIPQSFASMRGLISLNLSRNGLTGNIIPDIGQMKMLECLDLSDNQLSGQIPASLAELSFLGVLNLSNNNLSGKIPLGPQLQSFNVSSYAGNSGLCGRPLTLCPEDSVRPTTTTREENDGGLWSLSFEQEFGISMSFGFIAGFWGVVGCLILKKTWRYAYFNFLDGAGDWFYLRIITFLSKWRHLCKKGC